MKKLYSYISLTIVLLFPQFALSEVNHAAFSDPLKPILIEKQHPHFTIKLKANLGTGYTWILKSANGDYIDAVFQKYIPSNSKMMGAPGVTEFGFVAKPIAFKVTRQFKITFVYARPWEIASTSNQVSTFIVVTQGME